MSGNIKPGRRTTTEAELRDLVDKQGKTIRGAAQLLGLPTGMVQTTCSVLGIRSSYGKKPHAMTAARAYFADFQTGMSLEEVGKKHGCTRQNVHDVLRRAGLPSNAQQLVKWLLKQQSAPKLQPVADGVDIDAVHRRAA